MSILGSNVTVGYQKGKTLHSDAKYTLKECQEQHGLTASDVWYKSFEWFRSHDGNLYS